MTKKEALLELQQMSIEEKIARLSPTEEAYVRGLIDGAILDSHETSSQGQRQKNSSSYRKE